MSILKQIVLDIINFWYIFFDHPKLSKEIITTIDTKIKASLKFPKEHYSCSWKISRWKIFSYQTCSCPVEFDKKILIKIFITTTFGVHYSQIQNGIYCLRCENVYTKKQEDLD